VIEVFLKIGFDGGYGNTKLISSTGRRIEVPSVVGAGFKRSYGDIFGKRKGLEIDNLHACVDGEDYFIGALALKESRTPSAAFAENKINHPNTKALIASLTALAMEKEKENIIIVASLPFVEYKNQKREFKEYLNNFEAKVILYDGEKEIKRHVFFRYAGVAPQAAAAIYYLPEVYKEILNEEDITIAVIDIGMKTLDVVVVEIADDIQIIESMSFGFHTGISLLHDYLQRAIQDTTDLSLNIPKLDAVLKKGGRWGSFDFSEAIEKGKKELAKMIIDEINEKWGQEQKYKVGKIFLIGGGGEYLYEELKNSKDLKFIKNHIELPAEPRFINARGCLVKAQEIEEIVLEQNVSYL